MTAMTVMVETDDHQVFTCAQCGRDDCLMSDFAPSDADVMWEG